MRREVLKHVCCALVCVVFYGNSIGQIIVSKKSPTTAQRTANGRFSLNDTSITLQNIGVSASYQQTSESVAVRNQGTTNIRGIRQVFTWNTPKLFNGIGILVSSLGTTYVSDQAFKLELHEVAVNPNNASEMAIVRTVETFTLVVPATMVEKEKYLYLQLQKAIKLNTGTTYGFHLVPTQDITASGQQVSFLRSNSALVGNGSQSTSLSITGYRTHADSPDYNFYLTTGEGSIFKSLILTIDKNHLAKQKLAYLRNSDPDVVSAVNKLISKADSVLSEPVKSVMMKKVTPPSGSKHDYFSQAPYWWPNSTTSSGLPYVQIDGRKNPEVDSISDYAFINDLEKKCRIMSLAYFFTNNELYASNAANMLRTWFLRADTKMNPNLTYSNSIPGVNNGIGTGMIESKILVPLTNWISILQTSKSLSSSDVSGLKKWYSDFLAWARTSKSGITEKSLTNNRGTFYDLQIASFAAFTGDLALARQVLDSAKARLEIQFDANGKQPHEMSRMTPFSYSSLNLSGWVDMAIIGQQVGVDLWNYKTVDGKSIRRGLDWFAPYALGERPTTQEPGYKWDMYIYKMLASASLVFDDAYYGIKARNYCILRNFAKLKTFPHYVEFLLYCYTPPVFPNQIVVSTKKPTIFKPSSDRLVSVNDTNITLKETSVSGSFGWLGGAWATLNTPTGAVKGVKQTFTWNSSKPLNGIGILVSNTTTDSLTQDFMLEIHQLKTSALNVLTLDTVKTVKRYFFSIHATEAVKSQYLQLLFRDPLLLVNGGRYGFHLVPISKVDQQLSFEKSGFATVGNSSQSTSLSIPNYGITTSLVSLNFYMTAGLKMMRGAIEEEEFLLGEEEVYSTEKVSLWPNPIQGSQTTELQIKSRSDYVKIQVWDMSGNSVLELYKNPENGVAAFNIPAEALKSGLYIVSCFDANSVKTGNTKLLVE